MGRFVMEASNQGANLVVLPELCTSGYSFLSEDEMRPYAELVTNPESPSILMMTRLARAKNVAIVWGFPEQDGAGNLYNSQAIALPDGQVHFYQKRNRWANDWIWAQEGTRSPAIVEFMGKKVGLLICRDIRDKVQVGKGKEEDIYEKGDADIVAFSSNFGDGGFPSGSWISFAKDNGVHLVVSNRYGKEENNDFGEGGVCVISPEGKVHCQGLKWSQDCIVYHEIP